eukprot:1056990-Pelagomonas_calceolata.AAC.2
MLSMLQNMCKAASIMLGNVNKLPCLYMHAKRIWTGRSASLTNSRSHSRRSSLDGEDEAAPGTALRTAMRLSLGLSSSRRSSLAGGDVVVSRMDGELRKSSPDGFPGLRRPRALFKSASSLSQGARRGEEQEQQPQQDWGQQLQQQHDPE